MRLSRLKHVPYHKAWDVASGMGGLARQHQSPVAGREQLWGQDEEQTSSVRFPGRSWCRTDTSEQAGMSHVRRKVERRQQVLAWM